MLSLQQNQLEEKEKSKVNLQQDVCSESSSDIIERRRFVSLKKNQAQNFVKRISPFLIAALCLPILFAYFFINDTMSFWVTLICILFLEINILFIDYALWNYYEGKKKAHIWMIEISVIFLITYFIV